MSDTRVSLAALLENEGTTARILFEHLASLSPQQRVDDMRGVPGGKMARLFTLCADSEPLVATDIVPEGATGPIIHEGKNSLPMFSLFQKRFAKQGAAIIGYNHQTWSFVTGPGYFTVVDVADKPKELLFDYTKVPEAGIDGWPKVRSNSGGFSYFVYRGMHDFCRKVGPSVLIGCALREGKPLDSYFMLTRVDG